MAKIYYCHKCGAPRGYLRSVQTGSLLDETYQLGKHLKHTVPDPTLPVQSVFASPSTASFEDYIVSSALSGSVEIDEKGRTNIFWGAGKTIGFKYENGILVHPEDVVKVVLSTDSKKIHAFPQSSTVFHGQTCADCGGPAFS